MTIIILLLLLHYTRLYYTYGLLRLGRAITYADNAVMGIQTHRIQLNHIMFSNIDLINISIQLYFFDRYIFQGTYTSRVQCPISSHVTYMFKAEVHILYYYYCLSVSFDNTVNFFYFFYSVVYVNNNKLHIMYIIHTKGTLFRRFD